MLRYRSVFAFVSISLTLLIPTKKEMGKKTLERGYSKTVYKEDHVLVAWKDSKGVFVASNKHSAESSTTCKQFCRTKRTDIMVRIPDMIREYNIGMGGCGPAGRPCGLLQVHRTQTSHRTYSCIPLFSFSSLSCGTLTKI
jgi:hypothetical protein